jgi:hypothetical protein
VLEKVVRAEAGEELFLIEEVVVNAVDLTGADGPGRRCYDITGMWIAVLQALDNGVLADARRPGDDEDARLAFRAQRRDPSITFSDKRRERRVAFALRVKRSDTVRGRRIRLDPRSLRRVS